MTAARPSRHRRQFERRWLSLFAGTGLSFRGMLAVGRFLMIARNSPGLPLPVLATLREREREELQRHLAMAHEMARECQPAPEQTTAVFVTGDLAANYTLSAAPVRPPASAVQAGRSFTAGIPGAAEIFPN